jgi:hypothetical protein
MVGKCGRSLSLILSVLTLWPTGVEGRAQQQEPVTIEHHVCVVSPLEADETVDTVDTVDTEEVRMAISIITRYVAEQTTFWVRSLITSQTCFEE